MRTAIGGLLLLHGVTLRSLMAILHLIELALLSQQKNTNGILIWMECTIYRKDRSLPIMVREYFAEVKGEQAIWQKMPRRMLRHRVMQQCARLAMG